MGTISSDNQMTFKCADSLFSRVKEDLKSYDELNLIDEGMFPKQVKRLLDRLGLGVKEECKAVLTVKNYKASLPEDFSKLHAAYLCERTPDWNKNNKPQFQGGVVYNEITNTKKTYNKCHIDCPPCITEKTTITVKTYVNETPIVENFRRPRLMRLSPNIDKNICDSKCANLFHTCDDEISIDLNTGMVYTNFDKGHVLILYYGFPTDDDTGLPMIPNDEIIEEAIEYRLKSKLFEEFYVNNSVPDIEKRYQLMLVKYKEAFGEAMSLVKLTSFQQAIEMARKNRSKTDIYHQMGNRYYS